jgi:hypothetical protein
MGLGQESAEGNSPTETQKPPFKARFLGLNSASFLPPMRPTA